MASRHRPLSDDKPNGKCWAPGCDSTFITQKGTVNKVRKTCCKICEHDYLLRNWYNYFIREAGEYYNWTCQKCRVNNRDIKYIGGGGWKEYYTIEIHHITPISDGGALLDPFNVTAYCRTCHGLAHREINMKKKTQLLLGLGG
jgi:hypothetical protein